MQAGALRAAVNVYVARLSVQWVGVESRVTLPLEQSYRNTSRLDVREERGEQRVQAPRRLLRAEGIHEELSPDIYWRLPSVGQQLYAVPHEARHCL